MDDGGECGVGETGMIVPHVVAAIAHQQGLVADEGFLWEEGIVEAVLEIKDLV